ncbi:hypothetical protein MKY41_14365 [Sporosarcina sp. FSL W7-1349]|uniref:hypothetical protein n=1 Tax=Sporosarcina sp. FSL W7-1349 TaxID=2921561 RepID=UPI0030F5B1E4
MPANQHCEEVDLLLEDFSEETVPVAYGSYIFQLPKIGERPPYYYNPRCEPYYPVI